jgi:hypothetical protein
VVANRAQYRAKFAQVTPVLASVLDVALPDAGFYLWAGVTGSDTDFARDCYAQYNVTVLPGSYLAREAQGSNPGAGASAWRWWLKPPNVLKRRSASSNLSNPDPETSMTQQLQQIIDAAWEDRANISAASAPKEVADAVEHVIAELNTGRCAWPPARPWASGRCTSGSRRPCC